MKEELLFVMYKDKILGSSQVFKGMITKYKVADPTRLYTRIVNYQIKKYGETLSPRSFKHTEEQKIKVNQIRYSVKRYRVGITRKKDNHEEMEERRLNYERKNK